MSSRGRGQTVSNPVSLFPFLAVLICTMGTLILLLVVISRMARIDKLTENHTGDLPKIEDIESETGMTETMLHGLLKSKTLTERQIEEERTKIAVLEQQIEKLTSGIEQTLKFLEERQKNKNAGQTQMEQLQKTLRQKQSELATLFGEYQKLQGEHAGKNRSYAIVPYRGPNGTFKRPIYIECTSDKVILQPEGIVLNEMDFILASHPDNPLDAAIRAAYQYYLERGLVESGSEPYPLLLVRSGGIDAYYAVREAIRSWNDNFGYELIADDWTLEFPDPNPELKEAVIKRVDFARLRLTPQLNALMARQMRHSGLDNMKPDRSGPGTRSSAYGNVSENTGIAHGTGMNRTDMNSTGMNGAGDILTSGGWNDVSGNSVNAEIRNNINDGINASMLSPGNGSGLAESATGGMRNPSVNPSMSSGTDGGMRNASLSTNPSMGQGESGETNGMPAGEQSSGESLAEGQTGGVNNPLFARSDPNTAANGSGRMTMEQIWGSQNPPQTMEGSPPYTSEFPPQEHRPFQRPPREPSGEVTRNLPNWTAPGAGTGMTAIGRTIPLTCQPDKLVFSRSGGKGVDRELTVPGNMAAISNPFADTVWDYIDTWGDAGRNMYWRPTLKVTVLPGAEAQFEQLQMMLKGSGLKVERVK
jgi:hypothetical protein